MPRNRKAKTSNWPRTSQIIFGERRSLENVLRLVRNTRLPADRRKTEVVVLRELIALRTAELNAINLDWDRKADLAGNPQTSARVLEKLGRKLPRNDYYLARALSDHPNASPKLLAQLARHVYGSVRENVARHPKTPAATLRALARRRDEPLWYLVAFNPGTPPALRDQLRARLRQQGEA